jgi:hypothetical protein
MSPTIGESRDEKVSWRTGSLLPRGPCPRTRVQAHPRSGDPSSRRQRQQGTRSTRRTSAGAAQNRETRPPPAGSSRLRGRRRPAGRSREPCLEAQRRGFDPHGREAAGRCQCRRASGHAPLAAPRRRRDRRRGSLRRARRRCRRLLRGQHRLQAGQVSPAVESQRGWSSPEPLRPRNWSFQVSPVSARSFAGEPKSSHPQRTQESRAL